MLGNDQLFFPHSVRFAKKKNTFSKLHAECSNGQSAEPSSTPILPGTRQPVVSNGLSGCADDDLSLVGLAPLRCRVCLPLQTLCRIFER